MFLLMLIGVGVREGRLLSPREIRHLNHMVFVVCYPAMMFENLYGADIEEALDWKLILFGLCALFTIYFVSIPIVCRIEQSPRSRGAMIQAIYRSNFVIMGLPVAMNIYGRGNLAVTAMMIAIIVPIYNVLAVITLESFRNGKPDALHVVKGVMRNPLILGAIAGLFFVVTGLSLPSSVESVISDLSVAATTMALIVLGASFNIRSMRRCKRNVAICVFARLVLVPGIFLPIAAGIGIRGVAFVTLVAMLASPTAISSFTMAQSMDSDGELAGNCVIFSSAFSVLTLFIWLFVYKNFGIF